jgi:hypothetical protein
MNTQVQRRYLGCGYESPLPDRVHLSVWQPPMGDKAWRGDALTLCAGYSTNLPEVTETVLMRMHWTTGNLAPALMGETATEETLNAIVVLESAYKQVEHWRMTPATEGGGG